MANSTKTAAATNRRTALKQIGSVGIAAAALATPSIAHAQVKTARLVTTWSRTTRGAHETAQNLADTITAMTDGRIKVELFAAGELVSAFDTLQTVQEGGAEMVHAPGGYWRDLHPGFQFFNTVPNGFTCEESSAWLRDTDAGQLWTELFNRYNMTSFIAGGSGVQPAGWYSKPITSIDDFKGLRFQIAGYGGEIVKRMGATPISQPADKLVELFFSGELDAIEWNGPFADEGFGLQKIMPYYMQPGFHAPGATTFLGVNRGFFKSLSSQDQAIIQAVCDAEDLFGLGHFRAENGVSLERLVREYDAKVTLMPQEVSVQASIIAEEVIEEKSQTDDLGRRIYDSFVDYRELISPWSVSAISRYAKIRHDLINAAEKDGFDLEGLAPD